MNLVNIGGRQFNLPTDINNYWTDRMNHDLYRLCAVMARAMFSDAKSAIDVGSYIGGLLCELDWIEERVASDIQSRLASNWSHVTDVKFVSGDAFEINFPQPFDLVISNQTVEHLEQPAEFIEKLLSLGRGLIVSTTYEVAAGTIDGHVQDPISFEKFRSWFPCELDTWVICHHPSARHLRHIIGVVKQSHPLRRKR